jgi:HTH-type transcriptional regulator / antitoxin HigA
MTKSESFQPTWVSSPGDTINSMLEEMDIGIADLADGIGLDLASCRQLVDGNLEINPNLAYSLAAFLGRTSGFWLAREKQYQERVKSMESGENFIKQFPIADMLKFGWLQPTQTHEDMFRQCLAFFQVSTVDEWKVTYRDVIESAAFRTSPSFDSETGAVAAWLREGERRAALVSINQWNRAQFLSALSEIRGLTRENDPEIFIPKLVSLCAEAGVSVVILRAPKGCRASGATRIVDDRVMLLLSFRYLSNDHFWFTFFHEAGHIILHHTRQLFVDSPGKTDSMDEQEADDFAANFLIPENFHRELSSLSLNSKDVIRFSRRIGIAPGIVVGQLQHRNLIGRNQLNKLKRRFSWSD